MAFRYFEVAAHATAYNKFRPSPPLSLIAKIVSYLNVKCTQKSLAIDIGCGGGQSTDVLASFFDSVIGIDPSEEQILEAQCNNKLHNVTYMTGSAEKIEVPNNSVQLVTAAQAVHWFNLPKFYAEAERLLVSGGVLALYGYLLPRPRYGNLHEELCDIVNKYYNITLGDYVLPESKRVYLENYKDNDFCQISFIDGPMVRDESIYSEENASLSDLIGYISSWSAFQNYEKIEGKENASSILLEFEKEFKSTLGLTSSSEDIQLTVQYKYFLLMGRKR